MILWAPKYAISTNESSQNVACPVVSHHDGYGPRLASTIPNHHLRKPPVKNMDLPSAPCSFMLYIIYKVLPSHNFGASAYNPPRLQGAFGFAQKHLQ